MFCLAPRQKSGVLSFDQWLQAFEIYQSVLLLQPSNLPDAGALLMYIETIRKMYERGSDWWSYDQAFRTLRRVNNWAWDSVCMQLWMDASGAGHAVAPGGRQMAVAGALFRNKSKPGWGKAKWPTNKHCFAFNYGEVCNAETCRYTHKCKQCSGPHAFLRCNKRHSTNSTTELGITAMVHVINDFLLMAHSEAKCLHDLQVFCGPLFRTWHSIGSK